MLPFNFAQRLNRPGVRLNLAKLSRLEMRPADTEISTRVYEIPGKVHPPALLDAVSAGGAGDPGAILLFDLLVAPPVPGDMPGRKPA